MAAALYPGTFDPITLGHLDVLRRARAIFETVEVGVAVNAEKTTLFTADERVALIRASVADAGIDGVTVTAFEGLVSEYARARGVGTLVRGLRQVSDFDFEFRMAAANHRLHPGLDTAFLMTGEAFAFISSSIVRDVHRWRGDVRLFVPEPVAAALDARHAAAL